MPVTLSIPSKGMSFLETLAVRLHPRGSLWIIPAVDLPAPQDNTRLPTDGPCPGDYDGPAERRYLQQPPVVYPSARLICP